MTREKFKEMIYKIEEYNDFVDELYKLKIDIYNCKYTDYAGIFFDELMKSEFGEDGLDLVSWWLYEDVDRGDEGMVLPGRRNSWKGNRRPEQH